jgi:methanogenic corrinoid protein MtbC1
MDNMNLLIEEFEKALLQINRIKAAELFRKCYEENKSFEELEHLAIHALETIGNGWEAGTISLSQVYMAGVICEELIEKYLPIMQIKRKDIPKMAIAVLQDHHALGKRLVYSILRATGFEIIDFGQGLGVEELVQKTLDNQIELLLISTLMLPSALKVREVKSKLVEVGATTQIIVGGAPFRFDENLWQKVGADMDGKNASSIIGLIEKNCRKVGG